MAQVKEFFIKDNHRDYFFKELKINRTDIKKTIKKLTFVKSAWLLLNDEFPYLLTAIIKDFQDKKDIVKLKSVLIFLSIHFYAIHQSHFFKFVQPAVMEYMVSNLTNKHDLKSLWKCICRLRKRKTSSFYDSYEKLLRDSDDKSIVDFIANLNTRIYQWVHGLFAEYMKHKDSGKYFNSESESMDDEDYRLTTNISLDIEGVSNDVSIRVISNGPQNKLIKVASKVNNVSYNAVNETIREIYSKNKNEISDLIKNIMIIYYVNNKNKNRASLKTTHFRNSTMALYKQNNTISKQLLKIKEILDKWLNEYCPVYEKDTKNRY